MSHPHSHFHCSHGRKQNENTEKPFPVRHVIRNQYVQHKPEVSVIVVAQSGWSAVLQCHRKKWMEGTEIKFSFAHFLLYSFSLLKIKYWFSSFCWVCSLCWHVIVVDMFKELAVKIQKNKFSSKFSNVWKARQPREKGSFLWWATRKQSPAPCHGQPGLGTCLITACVSIPALFHRAKEMVGLVPHWNQIQKPWKLLKMESPLSAKSEHHVTSNLEWNCQNWIFYRKDRHLLVISKLWSHCSYFAYQVLFQCQDLFCFTLSFHCWFKSCSWHWRILRVLHTEGCSNRSWSRDSTTQSYFLGVSTRLCSGLVRVRICADTTDWPQAAALGN